MDARAGDEIGPGSVAADFQLESAHSSFVHAEQLQLLIDEFHELLAAISPGLKIFVQVSENDLGLSGIHRLGKFAGQGTNPFGVGLDRGLYRQQSHSHHKTTGQDPARRPSASHPPNENDPDSQLDDDQLERGFEQNVRCHWLRLRKACVKIPAKSKPTNSKGRTTTPVQLKRIIGTPTAMFLGMGVAIGSGIFRTPGEVAPHFQVPWLIILGWMFGGAFVLVQGLVTAELATRFPRAGGEYVYLREAYGEFVAFFFGWAFTVFIIGGGAATIAAAFGDFGCQLLDVDARWSGSIAAGAIVLITLINALGLRSGAGFQNVLTLAKIAALMAVVVIGLTWGSEPIEFAGLPVRNDSRSLIALFSAGFLPIFWSYAGSTDSAKLAEEIKDVRRAMPRALIGSALGLTVFYVVVNLALMRLVPVGEMAGLDSVPGEAMRRVFGPRGASVMLAVAMLVCLGALSSSILATIRVTFALARDGLAFRFMSRMSASQAPVPALIVVAGFAVFLVLNRGFTQVLQIYFFSSAILFGLAFASLIVFRVRDRGVFPSGVFRCPAGPIMAIFLIVVQTALAVGVVYNNPIDAAYTTALLVGLGALYLVWKRPAGRSR